MATTVKSLLDEYDRFRANPSAMLRAAIQTVRDMSDGQREIVDCSNPLVFGIEACAVMTSAFMNRDAINTRRQYPRVAQTEEEVFLHMSDKEYLGIFSTPSRTTFSVLVQKDELLAKAVPTEIEGISKLVIPRNTEFILNDDLVFSMQYPIEIRTLAHGGLRVVYNNDILSPLQTLETNMVPYSNLTNRGIDWVRLDIPVSQFQIVTRKGQLNSATGFKIAIPLTYYYYYTRVYVEQNGGWVEIPTTHTDKVYDILNPTAVVSVMDGNVNVSIPQIYTTSGLLKDGIRIDVYETRGPLDMNLSNYGFESFRANFLSIDTSEDDKYVAPLKSFKALAVYSDKVVQGGSLAVEFETLRSRVINNAAGISDVPITDAQMKTSLEVNGYSVVKDVDVVTNRVFWATKALPAPSDGSTVAGAACSMETVSLSFKQLVQLDSVIDNGKRATITPDTVYQIKDGLVSFLPNAEVDALLALTPENRAKAVTLGRYIYTPWHYVLDTTGSEFDFRAYSLDQPLVDTKAFIEENQTTLLQVSTDTYEILRTSSGYKLRLRTASGDNYKALRDDQVHVQLAFIPPGEKDRAYMNGTLVSTDANTKERVFEFDLTSNFDVDSDDQLSILSFFLYNDQERVTPTALVTEFDLIWSTSAVLGDQYKIGAVDKLIGGYLLPDRIAGITYETIKIEFGDALKTLWSRSRSVIGNIEYQKWEVDVPYRYEEDIYQRDPETGSIFKVVNGELVYDILHRKGDPVLDPKTGEEMIKFRAGVDPKLDSNGSPIPVDERDMIRQVDILFLEGAYWFATDSLSVAYRKTLTKTLVSWIVDDLGAISKRLLEQTKLYFYPQSALGDIDISILDGLKTSIPATQAFTVSLYVDSVVYANSELRASMSKQVVQTLMNVLKNTTVAISEVTAQLETLLGNDIKAVAVRGLGGTAELDSLIIANDAYRCSVRKRLVARSDQSLAVEDDVTVDFIRHELPEE